MNSHHLLFAEVQWAEDPIIEDRVSIDHQNVCMPEWEHDFDPLESNDEFVSEYPAISFTHSGYWIGALAIQLCGVGFLSIFVVCCLLVLPVVGDGILSFLCVQRSTLGSVSTMP